MDDSEVTRIDQVGDGPRDRSQVGSGALSGLGSHGGPHVPATAPGNAVDLALPRATLPAPTPTHIDRFVIVRKLGEGGMGVVYYAFDPELERPVALKLLRPAMRSEHHSQGEARLLREAQAMARLSHPNVVQVFDAGKFADAVFLAMEYVAGRDLRAWLTAEPRTWRQIVGVFLQAGQGLAAAHAAGVVHRDFKPDNVLVGDDGRVRVLDFGLARPPRGVPDLDEHVETTPSPKVTLTQVGSFIGTPAYMSPEQHLCQPADARSDQFAFCVALFEALYGRRPFTGRTAAEIRVAVFRSLELPVELRPVPGHLRRLLIRGLQRAPADRFPNMPALLAALAADPARRWRRLGLGGAALTLGFAAAIGSGYLAAEQRCDHGAERVRKVWDEDRAAAARAAFLATGVVYAAETWPKVQAELDAHAAAWSQQRDDFCAATHLRGEASSELLDLRNRCLDTNLDELDALVATLVTADAATVERGLQLVSSLTPPGRCAEDRFVRERVAPPGDPALADVVARARTHLARAAARREAGRPRDAREIASAVRRSSEDLDYLPLRAEALLELGRSEEATADYELARGHLASAYHLALGIAHDSVATDAAITLSLVHYRVARFPEAFAWSEHARSLLQRTGEPPDQRVWYLLYRSYIQTRLSLFVDAIAAASEGLALAEASFPANDPRTARMVAGLAHARWAGGSPDEALALFLRSQEILRAGVGREHPSLASAGINISSIHLHRHEWSESLAALRPTIELMERAYGPDSPNVADCLINLSSILAARGELREAVAASERAAAIYLRRNGPTGLAIVAFIQLGELQTQQGRHDAALTTLRRVLSFRRDAPPPERAQVHILIADALADERRGEAAELEYQAALDRVGQDPGRDIRRAVLRGRARLARDRGQPGEAITLAREALALDDPEPRRDRDEQASLDNVRAIVLHELGAALLATGQIEPALLACKEALALAELSHGPGAPLTLRARLCVARVYLARDQRAAARDLLIQAGEQVAGGEHAPALRAEVQVALADTLEFDDPERAARLRAAAIAYLRAAGPASARDLDAAPAPARP
ncbi:serine/threonine-protein kinase [Nannocystis sp.]|uniref:serine/threonine-protein kinase n=1 Tax=Nannocystis sp. TaxID=1962667 RepID=UPI0025F30ABC|nr:serine/threonine-protein kinase [Nannocystis sp.]MBK7826688.1 tetratricopeptide repeat protein [Nannocystis sp.]